MRAWGVVRRAPNLGQSLSGFDDSDVAAARSDHGPVRRRHRCCRRGQDRSWSRAADGTRAGATDGAWGWNRRRRHRLGPAPASSARRTDS
jgi:hypothetical protein